MQKTKHMHFKGRATIVFITILLFVVTVFHDVDKTNKLGQNNKLFQIENGLYTHHVRLTNDVTATWQFSVIIRLYEMENIQ